MIDSQRSENQKTFLKEFNSAKFFILRDILLVYC